MSAQPQHSLEAVLAAVERGQTITGSAHVLGVSRETMRRYSKHWQSVADALEAERDKLLDLAEMGLRKRLLDSEPWAVTFTLRTLGKSRGYVERQEHQLSGPGGGPIPISEVVIKLPDDSDGDPTDPSLGGEGQ